MVFLSLFNVTPSKRLGAFGSYKHKPDAELTCLIAMRTKPSSIFLPNQP